MKHYDCTIDMTPRSILRKRCPAVIGFLPVPCSVIPLSKPSEKNANDYQMTHVRK